MRKVEARWRFFRSLEEDVPKQDDGFADVWMAALLVMEKSARFVVELVGFIILTFRAILLLSFVAP